MTGRAATGGPGRCCWRRCWPAVADREARTWAAAQAVDPLGARCCVAASPDVHGRAARAAASSAARRRRRRADLERHGGPGGRGAVPAAGRPRWRPPAAGRRPVSRAGGCPGDGRGARGPDAVDHVPAGRAVRVVTAHACLSAARFRRLRGRARPSSAGRSVSTKAVGAVEQASWSASSRCGSTPSARASALLGGRDRPVAGHDHHGAGLRQVPGPRRAVEPAELAAGLGEVARAAARQLRRHPAAALLVGALQPHDSPPDAEREGAEQQPQPAHRPPHRALPRVVPVERGGAQHQPGDPVRVGAGEQLRDRAPHRVAGDQGLPDAEHVEQRGRVVGAVLQPERRAAAQAAPVPAQVGGEHPVAGPGQRGVLAAPVQVAGEHPPVHEQQHRPGAAGVAQEHLAAVRQHDGAAGRQGQRRDGRERRAAARCQAAAGHGGLAAVQDGDEHHGEQGGEQQAAEAAEAVAEEEEHARGPTPARTRPPRRASRRRPDRAGPGDLALDDGAERVAAPGVQAQRRHVADEHDHVQQVQPQAADGGGRDRDGSAVRLADGQRGCRGTARSPARCRTASTRCRARPRRAPGRPAARARGRGRPATSSRLIESQPTRKAR